MVTFKKTGEPLDEAMLTARETTFLKSLSADYVEFLRKYNGGTPVPDVIETAGLSAVISELFSFAKCFERFGRNEAFGLPFFVAAIGDDICGNFFCLGLHGEEKGKVYWKSHEADIENPLDDLRLVRASFTEFLEGITARDEPPKELDLIEDIGQNGTIEDLLRYLEKGSMHDQSRIGLSILEEAARHRNPSLVKKCAELGFPVGKALHLAAQSNQRDLVDYLIDELGCDINAEDDRGTTPWQRAVVHPELRSYLESRGATPTHEY